LQGKGKEKNKEQTGERKGGKLITSLKVLFFLPTTLLISLAGVQERSEPKTC
jgi:hypothetical protein